MVAAMVIASACLHPIWNMLLKGDDDRAASWWLFTVLLSVIGGIFGIVRGADFWAIRDVMPFLALSWLGQFIYGLTLIRIYEQGDLSAYYPIIRASPIGVVILGFLFLDKSYGAVVLVGIALSVVGAIWLQKQPGRRLLDSPRTLGLAVLSMFGTALYSIGDAQAVRVIEPEVMFFWVEAGMVVMYLPALVATGHGHVVRRAMGLLRTRPARQLTAGVLAYVSYGLILLAYSYGGDVAAVTTTRQLSIPLSVVLGGMILKESLISRRLSASVLLVLGIIVVIFGS